MKKITVLTFAALVLIGLNSCRKVIGTGPTVSETRNPGTFTAVEFELPAELTYVESNRPEVIIEAQQNIIDIVETNVTGSTLRIKLKNNRVISLFEKIKVMVNGQHANSFKVSGSGNLSIPAKITGDQLKLKVSGSGKIVATELQATDLEVNISGSGNIEGHDGEVTNERIIISGSGDVDLSEVSAENADTETSGSGDIKIFVNERLNARIAGSGDVWYKGRPLIHTKISGSGNVRSLD